MIRFLASLLIIVASLILPWWLTLPMFAVAIVFFHFFLEAVVIALVFDLVLGAGSAGTPFLVTIIVIVFLIIVELIKTRTRLAS